MNQNISQAMKQCWRDRPTFRQRCLTHLHSYSNDKKKQQKRVATLKRRNAARRDKFWQETGLDTALDTLLVQKLSVNKISLALGVNYDAVIRRCEERGLQWRLKWKA